MGFNVYAGAAIKVAAKDGQVLDERSPEASNRFQNLVHCPEALCGLTAPKGYSLWLSNFADAGQIFDQGFDAAEFDLGEQRRASEIERFKSECQEAIDHAASLGFEVSVEFVVVGYMD